MEFGLNEVLSLLIVFVSLLLASFLLSTRSANYTSNLLLAFFLIIGAQDADTFFIKTLLSPSFPALVVFISLTVLLQIPLLYLYIQSVIYSNFKLKRRHLLHAIPFILINLMLIPRFYVMDVEGQLNYLGENILNNTPIEVEISFILLHTQLLIYTIACFINVNKYRRLLLENFSNASLFNYKWLFQLITIFAVEALLASLKNIFMFMGIEVAYRFSMLSMSLLLLGYIIWMIFRAMHNPALFRGIDSKLQLVKRIAKESGHLELLKGETSHEDLESERKIHLLNTFMTESEPYLNPSLTLHDLSKQFNIPTKELSMLINNDLNQHFFDFVNGFRIRKAMDMLMDRDKRELTVLEILYEVGFNSKSSFNTAFKKHTRLTPTEFRRKYLLSAA